MRRLGLTLSVFLLLASATTFAATTGRISGSVVDNEGLAVPGVTIMIASENLIGGPQVAISDAAGQFAFNLLPIGLYTVEANLSGFRPVTAEVRVTLDRLASIGITMIPEQFMDEIVVTADVPLVDTTQVNTSVVFDQAFLKNAGVGTAGRSYHSVLGTAAGVAGTSNPSVYGGTAGDNRYLVDGLNTTDPLLGTFGTNFNYDAIQEISFQTGGFEAEFGQATGGIVNLVTKSGGNDFSGSLDMRYRNESFIENGDHFNRDEQTSSSRIVSGTFGGPILRDKLWFFLSAENILTQRQDQGAPVVREFSGWNYIGKATWQATDNNRLVFKYSGDPAEIPGVNSSQYITREASGTQEQGGDIWQAELSSLLSESVVLNAQIGYVRGFINWYPTYAGPEDIAHYNNDTLISSESYPGTGGDNRDRDEYRINMSVFADDLAGSHEFKFGGDYNVLYYDSADWYTGSLEAYDRSPENYLRPVDLNGDGYLTEYVVIEEPLEDARNTYKSDGNLYTGFVQDSWRLLPNLTIKPGVRVDFVTLDNHVGEQVADMDRWQPRLGAAWDITGNAKYVVRGSWGRFMDSTALSIPNFASGVVQQYNNYRTMEYYCTNLINPNNCNLAYLEARYGPAWQYVAPNGSEWVLWDNPDAAQVYDPAWTLDQLAANEGGGWALEAPYADELILALEMQPFKDTSIELSYVDKTTKEIIEDTCSNNTWVWDSSVPQPNLDDTSTWTTAGGCTRYIIANHPNFYRDYTGYIAKVETRTENFHVMGSYTYSESWGNTANGSRQSYATELADYYPVHFVNQEGWMPDQRDHRIKLNGYYLLPHDWTIGLDAFWSSPGKLTQISQCGALGSATDYDLDFYGISPELRDEMSAYCSTGDGAALGTTDIYVSERGAYETDSTWQVDMQVSKGFKVGAITLEAVFTVENLFDQEQPSGYNTRLFVQERDPETNAPLYDDQGNKVWRPFGAETSWSQPRRYELGFRIEF